MSSDLSAASGDRPVKGGGASLPLVRSAFRSVSAAYWEVKGRYHALGLIGGGAQMGVSHIAQVAMKQATPLLQSLEPQSM